jgi:hypothetical protein
MVGDERGEKFAYVFFPPTTYFGRSTHNDSAENTQSIRRSTDQKRPKKKKRKQKKGKGKAKLK